jgi:small subunit ribosomal protein S16
VKHIPPIEQVGTYDPIPNEHGEKLCSLNLERIAFYVGQGIKISEDVSTLLGKI